MKRGQCGCGNPVYFGNSECLACGRVLGNCIVCGQETSFSRKPDGLLVCDYHLCGATVTPCSNSEHGVCTWMVPIREGFAAECEWCKMTTLRPDLQVTDHTKLWAKLERAKQRFLVAVKGLKLPPFSSDARLNLPLTFRFPHDSVDEHGHPIPAITGHSQGVISIRLLEADSVLREKTRVELQEPHRSLISHFRHEYGHYLDWATWTARDQQESIELFGDPHAIDYEAAKQCYYHSGPADDWSDQYVSPYASMHPWEDFAETVALYLDMNAICSNAEWFGWKEFASETDSIEQMVNDAIRISCFVSECNLDMGFSVLIPEVINPKVLEKLSYIHRLRKLPDELSMVGVSEELPENQSAVS
ncbi:MAG: putative zinc-binding metallopeptidase [Pirellulales bacterium]